MRVFFGNLPFTIRDSELKAELTELGYAPSEVKVITDRETGQGRGFAFVAFDTDAAGHEAIEGLNGQLIGGREVRVSEAHERSERLLGSRGGGSGGGGGGGWSKGNGRGGGGGGKKSQGAGGRGGRGRRDEW